MKPVSVVDSVIYIEPEETEKSKKDAYGQKYSLYGLTKESYLDLANQQGNQCASCGHDATGVEYRLCVDHDHETNEIRGLLCSGCNTALGWLGEDPERMYALARYIQRGGTGVFIPERTWK